MKTSNELLSDEKILKQIKQIISKYINIKKYKIFLFGSRVLGNNRYNSDYDIGIIGEKQIQFDKLLAIRSELEELPIIFDLVDFNRVTSEFKEIVFPNIKYI